MALPPRLDTSDMMLSMSDSGVAGEDEYLEDPGVLFGRRSYPNKTDMIRRLPLPFNATKRYVYARRNRTCDIGSTGSC
jgi:hypothetical protein